MLTELSIINSMLATQGIEGLTASDDTHPDYKTALAKLTQVKTSVLKLGMWFNTTYPTWQLNDDLEIVLPNGTLHCDPVDTSLRYVKRGSRLYDLTNRTFFYTLGTTVQVKHIQELQLTEMPETALDYLRAKAAYEFYLDQEGTEVKLKRYFSLQGQAWTELYREDLRNKDVNRMHTPSLRRMRRGNLSSGLNHVIVTPE